MFNREGQIGRMVGRGAGFVAGMVLARAEADKLSSGWHESLQHLDWRLAVGSFVIYAANIVGLGILGDNAGALVDMIFHRPRRNSRRDIPNLPDLPLE